MYDHNLRDMVELLIDQGIIKSDLQEETLKVLKGYWEDKIAIVWGSEDVIGYAKDQGKDISEEDARDILQTMFQKHDCEYGITWETINGNL